MFPHEKKKSKKKSRRKYRRWTPTNAYLYTYFYSYLYAYFMAEGCISPAYIKTGDRKKATAWAAGFLFPPGTDDSPAGGILSSGSPPAGGSHSGQALCVVVCTTTGSIGQLKTRGDKKYLYACQRVSREVVEWHYLGRCDKVDRDTIAHHIALLPERK